MNGQTVTQTAGKDLKTAILYVYGKEISEKLVEVSYDKNGINLTGYAGKPETARGNRNCELFYVNGRYIRSHLVSAAVESVYKTKLPVGKFPFFVIHMRIDPADIDVNVHPAKLEARFKNEEEIYNHLTATISGALSDKNLIPGAVFHEKKEEKPRVINISAERPQYKQAEIKRPEYQGDKKPAYAENEKNESKIYRYQEIKEPETNKYQKNNETDDFLNRETQLNENFNKRESKEADDFSNREPQKPELSAPPRGWPLDNCRIAGQIFETYWIFESGASIYLLDQHAAHERINYEKLLDTFKNKKCVSQRLLTPVALNLTHAESEIYAENAGLFERSGFEIEEIGTGKYALRGVPFAFDVNAGGDFFIQMLDKLNSVETKVGGIYETKLEAIARFSCKASVKGNAKISAAEAKKLCDDLSRADNPFTCPHGRPTIIEITRYEIEKRFKRV